MAFPVVYSVLSANLSMDEVLFNGVSEQRLFINQPVEVRVVARDLGSAKVKSPGGLRVSFKSSFSQLGSQFLQPKPSRCRLRKTVSVISFSFLFK